MEIKAIETHYNGYKFRSRLEARWAVFFDSAGIEWKYEQEGFTLPNGKCYLPDFYLPNVKGRAGNNGIYVEVKGKMTDEDFEKVELFSGISKDRNWFPCSQEERHGFPIICVGEIPLNSHCYDITYCKDERFWNAWTVDGDWYSVQFYKERNGDVGIWGWDNVDDLSGFEWFEPHFQKARYARFEHGQKG